MKTIRIYGSGKCATMKFKLECNTTNREIRELIGIPCVLVAEGTGKILHDEVSSTDFKVILNQCSPREQVRNFRFINRLNGHYESEEYCVVCLTDAPNCAIASCKHDAILCVGCAKLLKNCPYCRSEMVGREEVQRGLKFKVAS